jgi:hypothetical protein
MSERLPLSTGWCRPDRFDGLCLAERGVAHVAMTECRFRDWSRPWLHMAVGLRPDLCCAVLARFGVKMGVPTVEAMVLPSKRPAVSVVTARDVGLALGWFAVSHDSLMQTNLHWVVLARFDVETGVSGGRGNSLAKQKVNAVR